MRDPDYEATSDEMLVSAFVDQGDQRALEILLQRHESRVFGIAYRILGNRADALDTTQDVFLTVFRKAGSFRGQSAFTTWLYRLTTNTCHDIGRRKARAPLPVETMPNLPSSPQNMDARLSVEQALRRLPEEQRVAVVLRDIYDLDYDEIASTLGVPIGTVKSRIARGRGALAGLVDDREGQEPARGGRRLKRKT